MVVIYKRFDLPYDSQHYVKHLLATLLRHITGRLYDHPTHQLRIVGGRVDASCLSVGASDLERITLAVKSLQFLAEDEVAGRDEHLLQLQGADRRRVMQWLSTNDDVLDALVSFGYDDALRLMKAKDEARVRAFIGRLFYPYVRDENLIYEQARGRLLRVILDRALREYEPVDEAKMATHLALVALDYDETMGIYEFLTRWVQEYVRLAAPVGLEESDG